MRENHDDHDIKVRGRKLDTTLATSGNGENKGFMEIKPVSNFHWEGELTSMKVLTKKA